jgi:golgi-specific brefeldin A-resistance guanine nucleotide exchange factor 1
MRTPVVLHAISSFDDPTIDRTAVSVITGLSQSISSAEPLKNELANSPDFWSILQRLHRHTHLSQDVFDILEMTVKADPPIVAADNYESAVSLANDFATAASVGAAQEQRRDPGSRRGRPQQKPGKPKYVSTPQNPNYIISDPLRDNALVTRGTKAISIIYQLTSRIPEFISKSHLERNEAWATYWSPIFRSLSTQCVNPCREVRHQALSYLQRCLLSPDLTSSSTNQEDQQTEWIAIFSEVLFPLLLRLLKPEIYHLDPLGMSETRTQAATLLCKVFLHYLVRLAERGRMLEIWLKVLDVLDRLMNTGQSGAGDGLEEQVPESLKNILLVMADAGYLIPVASQEAAEEEERERNERVWEETRRRVERFLPGLFGQLFPDLPQQRGKVERKDREEVEEARKDGAKR